MKKIIGIIGRPDYSPAKHQVSLVYESLRTIICSLDCIPLGILPISTKSYLDSPKNDLDEESYKSILKLCDGFVMQGGTNYYDYDLLAVKYAHENNLPILGICLGMQTLGVYLGGKLVDLPENKIHNKNDEYAHDILIDKNSLLLNIIKKDKIAVNSRHHEHIIDVCEEYVSARYNEVIEAIEDKTRKFYLGVQWHPEDLNDENTKKIFKKFIDEVKKEK